jgi:hypothetical protein
MVAGWGACTKYERQKRCTKRFDGDLKKMDNLENIDVDGNIKVNVQEVGMRGTDWVHMAQDRNNWRTLVNAVTDLRFGFHKMRELLDWLRAC